MPTDEFIRFATDKWIPALRSGHYEQGIERLRTPDNTYCCLGVACDLVDPESWTSDNQFIAPDRSTEIAVLPTHLSERYGITDEGNLAYDYSDERVPRSVTNLLRNGRYGHVMTDLVSLNDAGVPFRDIATMIELAITTDIVTLFAPPVEEPYDPDDDY